MPTSKLTITGCRTHAPKTLMSILQGIVTTSRTVSLSDGTRAEREDGCTSAADCSNKTDGSRMQANAVVSAY